MIDKKYSKLNLLPIELDIFNPADLSELEDGGGGSTGDPVLTYTTSLSGTYSQGTIPTSRYVRVTLSCPSGGCYVSETEESQTYIFQGISSSSSTFVPVNSSYNFQSTIYYAGVTPGTYPYVYEYYLNTTQTNLMNQLSPGTYYVWFDGANRGTLTITSVPFSATVTVTRDFVLNNKLGDNPIIATLNWDNPTGSNLYYYSALSTSTGPVDGTVYGFYGPYEMNAGQNGSISIATQLANLTGIYSNSDLYLLSYKTTSSTWNILSSGFNSTTTANIFKSDAVTVRNLLLTFYYPNMSPISVSWGDSFTMPLYGGYNIINWFNVRLGQQRYISGSTYNTSQYNISSVVNGMTNNTYWLSMYGNENIRNTYYINYKSSLPSNAGNDWINGSLTYQVRSDAHQAFSIPFPDAHLTAASEFSEYVQGSTGMDRDDYGGTSPIMNDISNSLNIPLGSYGNVTLLRTWDYQKYDVTGTISAINSGSHIDISGATKSFSGYNYNFYNIYSATPDSPVSTVSYTSGVTGGGSARLQAESKPGYEFISNSIISYPFNADGSIASVPYDIFIDSTVNSFSSTLPAPLWGNSGTVNISYIFDPKMAGDIQVGMEMRAFDHPIFVSMGSQVTSFNYGAEKYDSAWPNTYVYDSKTYYKLNGATFNVLGTFSGTISDIITSDGYYSEDVPILIGGASINTNAQILSNAFINIPDATPVQYNINTFVGTGVTSAAITPTTYNVLTPTFTPSISSITKAFGYNAVSIYGNIYNAGILVQDDLTSITQILKPSYNDYNYVLSASKETYYINNHKIEGVDYLPYGINSYTLNKTTYQISTSKQTVGVSYTMNDGYQMNTSNLVNVGIFYDSAALEYYAADQTYNTFNIPASTIGNVIFKAPEPKKIQYLINVGSLAGIKGINSVVMTPNNYYISNSTTKQTVSATISVNDGYDLPTGDLTVIGSAASNINKSSFNINTNGFGDITVTPASPIINTYNITISPVNIPTYGVSGISSVTLNKTTYDVETATFTPAIQTITYTNAGFTGGVNTISQIALGSFGDKSFEVYANAVTFNINITKDASISTFNYGATSYAINSSIDTYNVLQAAKDIVINDIVVTNQLYLPKANFTIGTVAAGSISDKIFALSSPLKTNSITVTTPLPTGYNASAPNISSYQTTNAGAKTVLLTHTMNPGYAQPSGSLTVSNVYDDAGTEVSVTSINNRAFTIPTRSWGDIAVSLADAVIINYIVNFQNGNALTPSSNVPTGVDPTGFGISPVNYQVNDIYPRVFTVSAINLPGYQAPTWSVTGGSNKTATNFDMSTFNTTVPVVTVTGGSIITYNMNIIKGAGINNYKYGANATLYTDSAKLDTYNVLSAKTVSLNSIGVINSLWNPVANYNAIVVTAGNTGDKTNTVSTTLKTSNINKGTLPIGVGNITFNLNTYQSVINTLVRTVGVSYTMNNGYSIPSTMTVTGSLSGTSSAVVITAPNANQFNIAPNTWGDLVVTPGAPSKITYDISSGTLPYGMASMSYSIATQSVSSYQISTTARTVEIAYTMNNGFAQPTTNPTISLTTDGVGSLGTVSSPTEFSIPINGWGGITVTPNAISKIQYFINMGTKPTGINTVAVTPNNYYINNTTVQSVSIAYTADLGWSIPTANPTVVGSNTSITGFDGFDILTNGYGDITVTSANPIVNVYSVILGSNPKPAAINTWSVSPTTYRVTDEFNALNNTKLFTISATPKPGYQNPTWSINNNANSASWFLMPTFTETAPNLQITAGSPIEYNLFINYNTTNSGITAGTVTYNNGTASISNFNIETPNFTPVISGITYSSGYNGYNVSPSLSQINVGTIGNKTYTVLGTPITYNLNSTLGTGIKTAVLNKSTYNIQQTPFNIAWGSITYNAGYNGYTLSGDNLSVPTGAFGDRSYTITGNEITYNVTVTNLTEAGITSFKYGATTYNAASNQIDTFTVTSGNKVITLTDIVYSERTERPSTITLDTISAGSTGNRTYALNEVYNIYIDVYTNPVDGSTNNKIVSFKYNDTTFTVNGQEKVWIDYVVASKSDFNVSINTIIYDNGYTGNNGVVSYNFGNVNVSTTTTDITFETSSTILVTYTVTVNIPDNILSFVYGTTTYEVDSQIDTFTIASENLPVQVTNIVYKTGYTGLFTKNFATINKGSYGDITYTLDSATLVVYEVDINPNPKPAAINQWYVSPNIYRVIDTFPKTFNITATNKAGYAMPTWSINANVNSASSFVMNPFTTTVPSLAITAGSPIVYNIGLNYNSINSGITAATISPVNYNIESATFLPVISISITGWANGYNNGYTVTPSVANINVGSIGDKSYTIMGTPMTYSITNSLGTGISTATLNRTSYNIQQTPFSVAWSNITYNAGYSGYTLSGDNLSVPTGAFGNRSYSISANLINYNITVIRPVYSGINTFNYAGNIYNSDTQVIDTYTVVSSEKSITLTDITYLDGYSGVSERTLAPSILTGSTGDVIYELSAVNSVFIDVFTNPLDGSTNQKIKSFKYNNTTFTVSGNSDVWIDFFVETTSPLNIYLYDIVYEDGYEGPTTYNFGTLDPSIETTNITYVIDQTTLTTYDITVNMPAHITQYTYELTTYNTSSQKIDEFTIVSAQKSITLTGITYETGYTGVSEVTNALVVSTGTTSDQTYNIPAATLIVYDVTINPNPKPVAINQWSVSPMNYTVEDTYPKTFNITATNKAGYHMPTWSINANVNSASSFVMNPFTTTVPNLQITAGNPIVYNIGLNYNGINSGITAATISPVNYNIESATFLPVISITGWANGYNNGYTVTPSVANINVGSIGDISYSIMGIPMTYSISSTRGAGINTATLSKSTYNIQQTPFTVSWSNVTYNPGYDGYTLSGDNLSVPTGAFGNRSYTITGNEIIYNITIEKPETVTSFVYGGQTYNSATQIVDTYTVTSSQFTIELTNVVWVSGIGPSTVVFDIIPTGSIGDKSYTLADVKNVFIDIDSWTSADEVAKHYKIVSFKYKGILNTVGQRDLVWIDYFVQKTPTLSIVLTDIVYQSGYTGPTSYDFGNINPATVTPYSDKTYIMSNTTLVPYTVYIKKDHTIQSFRYKSGFTSDGSLITINTNDLLEVGFTVQSKLDVTVYNIVYTTGYEGYNNGPTSNPTTISYDSTNYNRTSNIGSTTVPTLVTYDKLTNYTISITKTDPSLKLTSFNKQIQYTGGNIQVVNDIYTILSDAIDITAIDFVYKTATNADGTWTLYTGPNMYGYDDGTNTSWSIPSGSTGNKTFTIPVNDITAPAVFNISYVGQSVTANGYTSEITPLKASYTYETGTSVAKNNTSSFTVVENADLLDISTRLAANDPIHYSYTLSSDSAGMTVTDNLVTISSSDFGDKVIDINWTEVIFSITVKDHYIIRDVYGIKLDVTKPSPISGLTTDANVFIFNYSLHNTNQNYLINNNIYNKTDIRRTGWTFVNAKETTAQGTINITGTPSSLTGFTVPATWYDNRVMRLVYTPNTYTITLTGADPITIIYDHEIQKWGPSNVPTSENKIFNGYEDASDIERITYTGTYNFANDSYSTNITFTPRWIDRDDFMSYDATSNVVVDSNQMEEVTVDVTNYSRFKESVVSPVLVQNILPDTAIESNQDSTNTKYMFKLLSSYIKLRKLSNFSIVKGYKTLTFVDSDLNTYLNNPSNLTGDMIIDMAALITQLENSWAGANATDLSNIGIKNPGDQWSYTSNRLATADVFRIMLKVSNSLSGPFTYWIFDGMIETVNLSNSKQNLSTKQDMFLLNTNDGLKEIMKIRNKDNAVIYDRTPYVLDNNGIITNWEDTIIGRTKPVDVYGLMPVNKDKVYSMNMDIKTHWKSESLVWSGYVSSKLPYSSNIRVGEQVGTSEVLNYSRIPVGSIYSSKINSTASLTLDVLKNYSVVDNKLVVNNLDSILGPGATEKGALSSDGAFYIPTFYYELSIDNANSSSLRTATLLPTAKRYVYTPANRNIGSYIVQGPASDVDNSLRFLLSDLTSVVGVYIGVLDSNLNSITSLIPLIQEDATNWYKLAAPTGLLTPNDYYTIVIETADKLMYNNLLIYRRFSS